MDDSNQPHDDERAPTAPARADEPDADDPLVARLRELSWPAPDDALRERSLERFRRLIAQRRREGV